MGDDIVTRCAIGSVRVALLSQAGKVLRATEPRRSGAGPRKIYASFLAGGGARHTRHIRTLLYM